MPSTQLCVCVCVFSSRTKNHKRMHWDFHTHYGSGFIGARVSVCVVSNARQFGCTRPPFDWHALLFGSGGCFGRMQARFDATHTRTHTHTRYIFDVVLAAVMRNTYFILIKFNPPRVCVCVCGSSIMLNNVQSAAHLSSLAFTRVRYIMACVLCVII